MSDQLAKLANAAGQTEQPSQLQTSIDQMQGQVCDLESLTNSLNSRLETFMEPDAPKEVAAETASMPSVPLACVLTGMNHRVKEANRTLTSILKRLHV